MKRALVATLRVACWLAVGWMVLAGDFAAAQSRTQRSESTLDWLQRRMRSPGMHERSHTAVLDAFSEVVHQPNRWTVKVLGGDRQVALGVIVDADGYIITKASELSGPAVCQLYDGRRLPAELIGLARKHDLAMLKVAAADLPVVEWFDGSEPAVGSLLATPGLDKQPVSIGVVSAAARRINSPSGVLGVILQQGDGGPKVDQVFPGSSAEKAGLKVDDVIASVNGQRVETRESLIQMIRQLQPGDLVRLSIQRGMELVDVQAALSHPQVLDQRNTLQTQNMLGGPISERRSGFPLVLQHDSVLKPNECGGPLVNLDGKAVGVNVARAGRVESYAIPADAVKSLLDDLKSGRLPPVGDEREQLVGSMSN